MEVILLIINTSTNLSLFYLVPPKNIVVQTPKGCPEIKQKVRFVGFSLCPPTVRTYVYEDDVVPREWRLTGDNLFRIFALINGISELYYPL